MSSTTNHDHFDPDMFGRPPEAKFVLKSFICPVCGAEFDSPETRSIHMVSNCADEILAAVDID
jgi:hypothetical protein